jgi:hypothetical protein
MNDEIQEISDDELDKRIDRLLNVQEEIELPERIDISSLLIFFKCNYDIENSYCDKHICEECGGSCCKNLGCYISPDDLKSVDYDTIKGLLDTGFVSIDWWTGLKLDNYEGNGYYLRMKNVGYGIVDQSLGGTCNILTKTGCPLEFRYRPKGGRKLIPGKCSGKSDDEKSDYEKYDCVLDWFPYIELLEKLIDEYFNK